MTTHKQTHCGAVVFLLTHYSPDNMSYDAIINKLFQNIKVNLCAKTATNRICIFKFPTFCCLVSMKNSVKYYEHYKSTLIRVYDRLSIFYPELGHRPNINNFCGS